MIAEQEIKEIEDSIGISFDNYEGICRSFYDDYGYENVLNDLSSLITKARSDHESIFHVHEPFTSASKTESQNLKQSKKLLQDVKNMLSSPPTLYDLTCQILRSDGTDPEIQDSMLELLGPERIENIVFLIQHRKSLISALSEVESSPYSEDETKIGLLPDTKYISENTVNDSHKMVNSNLGLGLRVNLEGKTDTDSDLYSSDYGKLREKHEKELRDLPNIYMNLSVSQSASVNFGLALPQGTKRLSMPQYEQLSLPMSIQQSQPSEEPLVKISELESWCHSVFSGYTNLNRIQSIVHKTAYFTMENMLVSAPTGAGKTDVAMLSILSIVRNFIVDASKIPAKIALDCFKIIYVAPMKALATEVTTKFSKRLKCLGISVREWTGDTQLTAAEVANTQIFVTTPEKWDVITRKSGSAIDTTLVKLLLLDEVHLLNDERGAVLENIVARTLRMVESNQSVIRIVGLSATLPNFLDVAAFLGVNPKRGLFVFDGSFRPVPLGQILIGVKGKGSKVRNTMNEIVYEKVQEVLEDDRQAMVFVHSRKDTVNSGLALIDLAIADSTVSSLLEPDQETLADIRYVKFKLEVDKSKNRELKQLFTRCIGIHHAGMLRSDRLLTERMFASGILKVLFCTSTLAWGVNLPAYAVIIKGTQVFNAEKGCMTDLSILDVLQIFGRAGRPQFEPHGLAYLITEHDRLSHYIQRLSSQFPIESNFMEKLVDYMNAEICSTGSISSVDDAIKWLGYTYWMVRAHKVPEIYGFREWDPRLDPHMILARKELTIGACKILSKNKMVSFDENTGFLTPRDLGRIASSFYITHETIEIINESLGPFSTEADVLSIISSCNEFDGIKVRDEEIVDLERLIRNGFCPCKMKIGPESVHGKINILLQAYISRASLEDFGLISDTTYIAQNSPRIMRAMFEIALSHQWAPVTIVILSLAKSIERRVWSFEHPLTQFSVQPNIFTHGKASQVKPPLTYEIMRKIEAAPESYNHMDNLREVDANELGELIRNKKFGPQLKKCISWFPHLEINYRVLPITRTVMRLEVVLYPSFKWNDQYHHGAESWWVWIEDEESAESYASEYYTVTKWRMAEVGRMSLLFPVSDPLPSRLFLRVFSDRWIGSEDLIPISFKHLILPEYVPEHTELTALDPLPISSLQNSLFEDLYAKKFEYFNSIQSQVFQSLYHSDQNILIGAPTGSGKTICSELAIFRLFQNEKNNRAKVVYIAPLKALVKERVKDWKGNLGKHIGKVVVELTGDVVPDMRTLKKADIIITTPEKWDSISRHWNRRKYVQDVRLLIIDEIHLLGSERGPVLEVIVSRMNYIGFNTGCPVRIVGLSTALANSHDLANWLNINPEEGLYNFRHNVRPVPIEIHIDGFPGRHYCPRMATMNKPIYRSILTHSPKKPVIVFVSSRRQTRLTAMDLISLSATSNPDSVGTKRFLNIPQDEIDALIENVTDENLRHCLCFGIGLHHAGLIDQDRTIVENLFVTQSIQILVATATVAWGLNTPAHLVIVKGTEFYDAYTKKYVDMPITDVLQMVGRAGRPQYDTSAVAHIMVHDKKLGFYTKFLYEPFPVESSLSLERLHPLYQNFLLESKKIKNPTSTPDFGFQIQKSELTNVYSKHVILADHLNAEIASGVINTAADAIQYMTWTYYFRRLSKNPTYYGLIPESLLAESEEEDSFLPIYGYGHVNETDVRQHLVGIVSKAFSILLRCRCITVEKSYTNSQKMPPLEDNRNSNFELDAPILPTEFGKISSVYYLSHVTINLFFHRLQHLFLHFDEQIKKSNMHPYQILKNFDYHEYVFRLLCDAWEFADFPVRHNEDNLNAEISLNMRYRISTSPPEHIRKRQFTTLSAEQKKSDGENENTGEQNPATDLKVAKSDSKIFLSPHVKVYLLLQTHIDRLDVTDLPSTDYVTDRNSVLDQCTRIILGLEKVAKQINSETQLESELDSLICGGQSDFEKVNKIVDVNAFKDHPIVQVAKQVGEALEKQQWWE